MYKMTKVRLDQALVIRDLTSTRSQAESWIRLGLVSVNGKVVKKTGQAVEAQDKVELRAPERYVSRAGLKLASVAQALQLNFAGKVVLDVGSSTGGFTDYALQHGAKKVIAVDVGTDQLHPKLRLDQRVELHERTDIRTVTELSATPDIVVIDVSFISLRQILPHITRLCGPQTHIVAMVKPQFEAQSMAKHKGVIKNDTLRRQILKDFETWAKQLFVIKNKADSDVVGAKGNRERFYLLQFVGR